jgi:hypothetical protein
MMLLLLMAVPEEACEPYGSSKIAISIVVPDPNWVLDVSFVAATLERHLGPHEVINDKRVFDHCETDLDLYHMDLRQEPLAMTTTTPPPFFVFSMP